MKISEATLGFVSTHANDDVRKLALSAKRAEGLDLTFALDQIAGRQMARTKLPSWFEMADKALSEGADEAHFLVFPPHISMEQCSSEQTAKYKQQVLASVLASISQSATVTEHSCSGISAKNAHFIDVTGGFGVDFSYLAQGFAEATYVERQEHLCEIAKHNFPLLGLPHANVVCKELESPLELPFLKNRETVVFIDPARRDTNGNRTYAIGDCTPNILGFIGDLLQAVAVVMVKLSPMLDWHQTVEDINRASNSGNAVKQVHIVSTQNECKELLLVLSERYESALEVYCANDDEMFVYRPSVSDEASTNHQHPSPITHHPSPNTHNLTPITQHLFVPNASIMKAGCFTEVEKQYGLKQIGRNSHLFVGGDEVEAFPGRVFIIERVTTMNKKELKAALTGIGNANIATRNFPMSPEQLRKRLKLKDGGDVYLFATTNDAGEHLIYVCRRR